jgi:hypothetical protein
MAKGVDHYLPTGQKYTGPTHKTGKTLMTGATHTSKSQVLTHSKPTKK